jgi:N-acetylglucosamine-6-sulfatase
MATGVLALVAGILVVLGAGLGGAKETAAREGPGRNIESAGSESGETRAASGSEAGESRAASLASTARRRKPRRPDPNIVVVVTDDQTDAGFNQRTMPATWRLLAKKGSRFTTSYVTTPACCPSRATFLTGQYTHNNGVSANSSDFFDLVDPENILPAWLQQGGYRTAHVGKYRYFFDSFEDPFVVLPGWSEWRTLVLPFPYYKYSLSLNGKRRFRRLSDRSHVTSVLNRQARRMVRRYVPKRKPLYLQLDHLAPHRGIGRPNDGRCNQTQSAVPAPRDQFAFANEPLPRPPSVDEVDVSDKPSYIQRLPRISDDAFQLLELRYQCDLASLREVDRGVAGLVKALKRAGELSNTAIIFTSDNGMLYGEHRIKRGKVVPYEPSARVPLAIRLPRHLRGEVGTNHEVTESVANVDLAPTILRLAGAQPCISAQECRTLDGRSLVGLARGRPGAWPDQRSLLLEWNEAETASTVSGAWSCEYQAIRASGAPLGDGGNAALYVENTVIPDENGVCKPGLELELYDLDGDPHQLENLHPALPGSAADKRQSRLRQELEILGNCAGIKGRDLAPASGHFCS